MEKFIQSTDYDPEWTRRSRENVPSGAQFEGYIPEIKSWVGIGMNKIRQQKSKLLTHQKLWSKSHVYNKKKMRDLMR